MREDPYNVSQEDICYLLDHIHTSIEVCALNLIGDQDKKALREDPCNVSQEDICHLFEHIHTSLQVCVNVKEDILTRNATSKFRKSASKRRLSDPPAFFMVGLQSLLSIRLVSNQG